MKITNTHYKPLRFGNQWVKPGEQADVDISKNMKERLIKLGHIKLRRAYKKKVKPVEEQQPDVEGNDE